MVHASDDAEKGQCIGFSSPKNALPAKPFHKAGILRHADGTCFVIMLQAGAQSKCSLRAVPCSATNPYCRAKRLSLKTRGFLLVYEEGNPSPFPQP